eukprot:TRINITY_DN4982_c0_g1_i3.p1 TRINITY_DN4982_c0_g1~~TRINITY_DN4982_c0_g1_i3.p1  ORF type:complete len:595 (-),score=163.71 TRINITY_DN4982_c0_g1_i3:627-2411(-)
MFRSLLLLVCLVRLSLGTWQTEFHPRHQSRELLQIVKGTLDETPRRDLAGNKVNHNFCAQDSEGNCQWQTYAEALGIMAVPGLLLAFLSLVGLPIFLIMRFGCNLWGGRRRSPGVFCGGYPGDSGVCWDNDEDDFKEYTTSHILYLRLALFLCFLLILVLCIVGFFCNRNFDVSVRTLGDTVVDTANTIISRSSELSQDLKQLPHSASLVSQLDEMVSNVKGYTDQAATVRDQADMYNRYRSAFSLLCFILPLIVLLGGCIGSFGNFRGLVFVMALSCFVASIFCWLSFAATWPMTTVVLDVCNDLQSFLTEARATSTTVNVTSSVFNTTNLTSTTGTVSTGFDFSVPDGNPVEVILKCQNGDFFRDVEASATRSLVSAFNAACSAVSGVCNQAPNNCSQLTCNTTMLPTYKQLVVVDSVLGCYNTGTSAFQQCPATSPCSGATLELRPCRYRNTTIQACATGCNNTQMRNMSSVFVTNVDLLVSYNTILTQQIFPLLDCSFVNAAFQDIKAAMCDNTNQGIDAMCTVSLLLGVVLVPTTFFLVMGRKRFRRSLHEDLAEDLNIGKKYKDDEERHWKGYEFEEVNTAKPGANRT